ncbi:MAG: NnrS family protein [Betaproteobacteria bacterium]
MALLHLDDPRQRIPAGTFSLWALGFRPFYLLAALFAALAVPVWVAVLGGLVKLPLPGLWWHAHEMLFGFVVAVVVGFLFTAGRNWTGLPTPSGKPLAALALIWLCGRIAMAFEGGLIAALIDVLFLPAAATALGRVLLRGRSQRNYFLPVLLMVMAGSNLAFHLARLQFIAVDPVTTLHLMLSLVVMLETIIGGRVIPSFTASALRGTPGFRQWQRPWLNHAAIASSAIALLLWSLNAPEFVGAPVAALAALLQLARTLGWNPAATRHTPLLWILHAGHLWIAVGLALIAAGGVASLPPSAPVHALAIGATGSLILGMITRTALGHTGRILEVSRFEVTAYGLIQMAAATRVLTLLALPLAAAAGIQIAATAWTLAFLLYLWRYTPWLIRSRADGQPG